MDRESMHVAHSYTNMRTEHFDGGYFSPAVRALGEQISTRSEVEKAQVYRSTFNRVWTLASAITSHPRFEPGEHGTAASIDLSAEGYGIIEVSVERFDDSLERDSDDTPAYRAVDVVVTAFDPVADADLQNGQLAYRQSPPKYWADPIFADPDGWLPDDSIGEIDTHIMRTLDRLETLEAIQAALIA